MIGCCCGEGNSKIYRSFILRRNNLFYRFLRPGQGQAIRKRMVLPAKLLPAARKSKNISLSNLVIFSTIQILTSPILYLRVVLFHTIIIRRQPTLVQSRLPLFFVLPHCVSEAAPFLSSARIFTSLNLKHSFGIKVVQKFHCTHILRKAFQY